MPSEPSFSEGWIEELRPAPARQEVAATAGGLVFGHGLPEMSRTAQRTGFR